MSDNSSQNKNFQCYENNNIVIGSPQLISTELTFNGKNNILVCEPDTVIRNSKINFGGDNSVIYLSNGISAIYLDNYMYHDVSPVNISVRHNSVFYIGRNYYINPNIGLSAGVTEEKNIFIGNDCFFGPGVTFAAGDGHLIYNANSLTRVNNAKSIFIGDHVWIGNSAHLLKGVHIGSGGIIGAYSVAAGKHIRSNTSNAGNPVKLISEDVFWIRGLFNPDYIAPSDFQSKEKELTQNYPNNEYIFKEDSKTIKFDYIDELLSNADTSIKKLNVLLDLTENINKNRFAVNN